MFRSRFFSYALLVYLSLCLIFGGASAAGALANGLLQGVGLALIIASLWRARDGTMASEARGPLWIGLLFVILALLYLIPVPYDLWGSLAGRDYIENGFKLLGVAPGWLPLSLDPHASISSMLSIIPPAAVFLMAVQVREEDRRRLPWLIIGATLVSIILGAFQLMGGIDSPLRFYEITNASSAVGFFSNTNHLATLVLCTLPFTGVLAARATTGRAKRNSKLVLALGVAMFLAVGIALIGSLAGYGLFPLAVLATALIYRRATGGALNAKWGAGLAALLLGFLALVLAGPFNEQSLSAKTESQPSRVEFAERTMNAIGDHMPIGTGLGTFANVYRLYDNPNRTDREYVNHTHNDYLEVTLELGLPGVLLILMFTWWWLRNTVSVWRKDFRGDNLARASTAVIGLIMLHSIVDYPLRTAAIASLFALMCALLVPYTGRPRSRDDAPDKGAELRHLSAE